MKDQPAAPSFNAFNSTVAGPAASSVDPVENANPRTKKPPKPACSILRTRRLPCLPAAASPGRADGFTSVELHNPGKIIKTAVAYRKKRASMARQKQMVHSFGALTLASGPLPTPFDSPRNDRPSASVIPPQAPKGGSVTAAGAIRADCEPQTMHLHNSPRIYDIDASAQTSPGRVCAPGLATARLASISAPAWTLTDSSMEQELGTEGITFENDNTRTRQSQTRPDNSATRMYFHARSKPDVDHDFQHSYDKTIFWPHYA